MRSVNYGLLIAVY